MSNSNTYTLKQSFLSTTTERVCLLMLLLIMSSCGPCPEEQLKERFLEEKDLPVIGMYNTGNWWVYQSTDGLKQDSIYIAKIDTMIEKDRASCIKYQSIEGKFAADRNGQNSDVVGGLSIFTYPENTFILRIAITLKSGKMIFLGKKGRNLILTTP